LNENNYKRDVLKNSHFDLVIALAMCWSDLL